MQELRQHGDTGIGTFHRLNGELIMLDGIVYRAAGDGSVEIVSEEETSPFSVVAFLDGDETVRFQGLSDYHALLNELNRMAEAQGANRFYMIRLDGLFREMHTRSVYAQKEPYARLTEVLEHDQTFADHENIEGTVVGLYCPPYMSALNAVGWHMHFISKDRTRGGHVLGLSIADAVLTWDALNSFELRLPQSQRFHGFDLTIDQSRDIEKIEMNNENP
jgi:acetolactate decarboxylase